MKQINLILTEDEIRAICYALNELSNRRQEQCLDSRYGKQSQDSNRAEAQSLRHLSAKLIATLC